MIRIAESEAIERARKCFGVSGAMAGEATLVRRLDGGPDYYLVTLREDDQVSAVVNIDSTTGESRESAKIVGGRSPLELSEHRASQLSGVQNVKTVELIWHPCRATRSPFYPVWRVTGETVTYVDQQGNIWHDLN